MGRFDVIQRVLHYGKSPLVKNTGIYLVAKLLRSCIPFLMLPVLTAYLSTEEYGALTMFTTVVTFTMPFVTIELNSAITRRYYYKNESLAEYIGNCFILSFCSLILVELLFIFSISLLSEYTKLPHFLLLLIPPYSFLLLFENSLMSYWQVKEQPIKYGVMSILHTLIEVSLSIFFIVSWHYNWIGRAISIIGVGCIFSLVSICIFLRNHLISIKIDKEKSLHALKFGGGLIPHAVGASLILLSNRFFITNMVGTAETGLYGVASQLSGVLSFFTLSFNNAFVPWLYRKLSSDSFEEKMKVIKFSYGYFLILPILAILILFAVYVVFPIFVNTTFNGARAYIPWIMLGYVFQGFYFMFTNYISFVEKTIYLAIITLLVGVISLGVNYLFISFFGGLGAAIAFAIVYFIYFTAVALTAMKLCPMPWFKLKMTRKCLEKEKQL